MGKLAEWCSEQPPWAVDAMQRAATTTELTAENLDAIVNRVALAHGLAVSGDHPCQTFDESTVVSVANTPDDVILRSVGPVQGLDRLVSDQTLQFAIDGLTVVFGENGAGKSGYTRALRQLCSARRDAELQGDVFATGAEKEKSIEYRYQQGNADPVSSIWKEGDAKPAILSGITLLDTENLRVYVENKNEILYLPPEVACVGRLAELYQSAAARFRGWITDNENRYSAQFGIHLQQGTTAQQIASRLQLSAPEGNLPSVEEIRSAAVWTPELEDELRRLNEQLLQGPAASAKRFDRISAACVSAAQEIARVLPQLSDTLCDQDAKLLENREQKRLIAEALRAEQIGSQPIASTGSDVWKSLFQMARQFAAEAGIKQTGESFEAGDPCPLCQQDLSEQAATRLAAFDTFMEGRAAQELNAAEIAVRNRLASLQGLVFKSDADLAALLGETAALDPERAALVARTVEFYSTLRSRRDMRASQLAGGQSQDLPPIPASPLSELQQLAATLGEEAEKLRSQDDQTAGLTARVAELSAQKQFHPMVEEAITRRQGLEATHLLRRCEAALNTGPLSRLISTLRKELLSPSLEARIQTEIAGFGLSHIPFKFSDGSERGASFFEVQLATDKKAKKSRVLSEGEQRALSLACFLAESHVAEKRSGIILDDPVTSLDHGRVRRVARRLVDEAGKGRQIVIFTHNLVFYHELMLACIDRTQPVPALSCLIQQGRNGEFGFVSVGDEPWVARKVKDRVASLKSMIDAIPDELAVGSEEYRRYCTSYYAALRETWERAVEEIVLNDVVRRFGSDVGTLRLAGVEVSDEDFMVVYRAMKRASEHSGHDQAAGRQIDVPSKAQMVEDWQELVGFRATKAKANKAAEDRRRQLAASPPKAAAG